MAASSGAKGPAPAPDLAPLSRRDTASLNNDAVKDQSFYIRTAVKERCEDMGWQSLMKPFQPNGSKPTSADVEEFQEMVDAKLDNNPVLGDILLQSREMSEEREKIEKLAIKLFYFFEYKEKQRQHISELEFHVKSIVDDILYRLLRTDDMDGFV
eukprot:Clim_evm46s201 gene=Clim_evmTU46s201